MKLLFLATLFLAGCASMQPQSAPSSGPTKLGWPNAQYEGFASQALQDLGQDLLKANPSDLASWCPNTASCDKRALYVAILAQLAKLESGFDTKAKYVESFKDDRGNPQISAGLESLSVDDGKNYGCGFTALSDLFDPNANLRCSVVIFSKWIIKDGVISGGHDKAWLGAARYWSQYRTPANLEAMRAAVQKAMQ